MNQLSQHDEFIEGKLYKRVASLNIDVSNSFFVNCEFIDLRAKKIILNGTKFEDCYFENVVIYRIISQQPIMFNRCRFVDCLTIDYKFEELNITQCKVI